jgi:hypothetical protein
MGELQIIEKVPATAGVGKEDHGIRFFGVTRGYEFASLLEDIQMVLRGESGLGPELERLVRLIDQPVRLDRRVNCPFIFFRLQSFRFSA